MNWTVYRDIRMNVAGSTTEERDRPNFQFAPHIVGDCFTKQYVQELKGLPFSMKIKMLSTFKLPPSRVRVHAWSMQIFASSV